MSSREDPGKSLIRLLEEVAALQVEMMTRPSEDVRRRLLQAATELGRLRALSRDRAAEDLETVRKGFTEAIAAGLSKSAPDEQATLTVRLSDRVSPAALAEILTALNTIHRELTGTPLGDLVVKIGSPEEIIARSAYGG